MSRPFLLVGLTGGIATGKSTVAGLFRELGAAVIDADQLAREVVAPGAPALTEIAREFGPEVLAADGTLDRARLGSIVFADPARRRRLEAITHPRIRRALEARLAALAAAGFRGLVVYDAALLVEGGGHRACDRLVVVVTDAVTERARLAARDGMAPDAAEQRIAAQMPLADKVALADHVIDNGGDRVATARAVARIHAALMAELSARPRG